MIRITRTRAVVATVAVCTVAAVVVSGIAVYRGDQRRTRADIALATARRHHATARADLTRAVADRDATQAELALRTAERDRFATAFAATNTDLQATAGGLFDTRIRSVAGDRRAASLSACLGGVATAIHGLDAGAAIAALRAAQPACTDALAAGSTAAFPFDFPDPFVFRVGPFWMAYSTNAGAGNIQVLASTDRNQWQIIGNALPAVAPWATRGATWAPAVVARNGGFALFYTARESSSGQQCISVATAAAPQGPFVDRSTGPLVCQHDLGGSIDASVFVDDDGQAWLTWKSEAPPTIWSRPLDLAQLRLTGTATDILHATRSWEGGNVEAPSFTRSGSRLVLAYSGNSWESNRYGVGLATCASPAGPCEKSGTGPALASTPGTVGPGGAEFFATDRGPAIAYAAYTGPDVGYPASRLLHLASFDPMAGTFGPA